MHQLLPQFKSADLPSGYDRERCRTARQEWWSRVGDKAIGPAAAVDRVLDAIFGNSPHLTRSVLRDTEFAIRALSRHPDENGRRILSRLVADIKPGETTENLMRRLRVAKTRTALVTALADIAGVWSLDQITGALTRFADLALQIACAHLLRQRALGGDLDLPPAGEDGRPGEIARGSGFILLAMGKLGAHELNYSSDIDLVTLYDPEIAPYSGSRGIQDCFNRIVRDLVRIMHERTADGYVFRVDLRLRPDAGATPVALSTDAAEIYYQSVGLNWERSAMIKARPVAGDIDAGHAFLDRISPFVWRRHLDYAALEDIHGIKKQIHDHHGHGGIGVAGHDIKLGHGGIREIEFFAQTQQLIAGGRDPKLRQAETLDALAALARASWVDGETRDTLSASYRYLRRLEHRLQMIHDQQTQTLPVAPSEIARLATFMGYDNRAAFEVELLGHLERVHACYEALFEDSGAPPRGAALKFPADEDRADDIAALKALGFDDPSTVADVIRGWQLGRYRACRTDRARRLLKEITPALLEAFSATSEPDAALKRFNDFLGRLPSGIQLFSLFQANPWLLELVAEIMGSAPGLAQSLGRNILLLDAVLDPDFFAPPPGRAALAASLAAALDQARDYEDVLDLTRKWANDRKFQIGVQVLRQILDGGAASRAQSDIAEVVIAALLPMVENEFAARHGRIGMSRLAVVAMGKLGGREMTPTSDLDLILIYKLDGPEVASDGARPLPPTQYFARLSQRLISALTVRTGEGRLYEVDMRLRPSGGAGPIAVELDGYIRYQRERAWTWEHMALTRARVISGPASLASLIRRSWTDILTAPRDAGKLARDVRDMRQRLAEEFPACDPWEVKTVRGGLQCLEFIAQFLQLRHAPDHPGILVSNTGDVFAKLGGLGVLAGDIAEDLRGAAILLQNVQGFLRLCFGDRFDPGRAPLGLKNALATAAGCDSFGELEGKILETQAMVARRFGEIIGPSEPAN